MGNYEIIDQVDALMKLEFIWLISGFNLVTAQWIHWKLNEIELIWLNSGSNCIKSWVDSNQFAQVQVEASSKLR